MIKGSSSVILEEFVLIINDTIEHFEKEKQIKSAEQKEVLKFESTALVFWVFQKTSMFPALIHELLLDEIHKQYYARLRKHGYDYKMLQIVSDDFNVRFKKYNKSFGKDDELVKVSLDFLSFLPERFKADLDFSEVMTIPFLLINKLTPKFKEWSDVVKN